MNNRIWKRFTCFAMAFMMIFSLAACNHGGNDGTDETTTAQETTAGENASQQDNASQPANAATDITLNFHYLRDDGNYDGWNVWLWISDGSAHYFGTDVDEHGVMLSATFPAGTQQVGYIVRLNEWEKKDIEADQFIDTSAILAGTMDVYVVSGVEGYTEAYGNDCVRGLGLKKAQMTEDYQSIILQLTSEWENSCDVKVLDKYQKNVEIASVEADSSDATKVTVKLAEKADQMGSYSVDFNGTMTVEVSMPDYFSSEEFDELYYYDGDDLGATYTKEATTFKVWAPTAKVMTLNLYEGGKANEKDLIEEIIMTRSGNGTWTATVEGDQNGVFYTYSADFDGYRNKDICDPYAKAVGVNGDRAMVIDLAATNPEGWDQDKNPNAGLAPTDTIVYEVSVRDTTMDASSGVTAKGQYLGMIEKGTKNANGDATALDYIVALGVTHVQIMPSYDFATIDESQDVTNQYNWGYDPKNYNVPEGSFSSDPTDGAVRVKEYKQMVQGLHNAGLSVNMDVVYNHTYNTEYCFNKLVPGYFYRADSNGSGCGNDVASERSMVRKFIVDSVKYWAEEYHLDGFRFDLVGLIDTDTVNAIREAVGDDIMLYGEGWSLTTKVTKTGVNLTTQKNAALTPSFAMFNDEVRDALKGSVFDNTAKGYVNNGGASGGTYVKGTLMGSTSWSSDPSQLVNYTSCHDNMTLWDEINSSNAKDSMEDRMKQNLLAAAVIYTSQGIPFMLSGEEILRTKTKADGSFDHNSYASPDSVNTIKWDDLADADHQTVLNYYKGLIQFRKAHAVLTQSDNAKSCYTSLEVDDISVIAFAVAPADGETSDGMVLIYNPTKEAIEVTLPEGTWNVNVQGMTAGTATLATVSGTVVVEPISFTALTK